MNTTMAVILAVILARGLGWRGLLTIGLSVAALVLALYTMRLNRQTRIRQEETQRLLRDAARRHRDT